MGRSGAQRRRIVLGRRMGGVKEWLLIEGRMKGGNAVMEPQHVVRRKVVEESHNGRTGRAGDHQAGCRCMVAEGGHRDGRALLLSLSPCRPSHLSGEECLPDGRLVRAPLVLPGCMPEEQSWMMNLGPTLVLMAFYRRSQPWS